MADPRVRAVVDDMAQFLRLYAMSEERLVDEVRLMCMTWGQGSENAVE